MLDRWIFDTFPATPHHLAAYRMGYALYVLLVVAPGHTLATDFRLLATFPDTFFLPPPGPMALFDGFPPAVFFAGLLVCINACAVALFLGYQTRWASWGLTLALLVGYGFSFSLGKINHLLLYLCVPPLLAAANWGGVYSLDALRKPHRSQNIQAWPLAGLALLVAFLMATAAVPKLAGGWLDPATTAVRGQFFNHFFINHRQDLLAPWFMGIEARWFWEMLDYATVVFEFGFLFALWKRGTFRFFLALAVLFHVNVLLMFNIPFVENLIVYAAFFNGAALLPNVALADPWRQRLSGHGLPLALIIAGTVVGYTLGSPLLLLNEMHDFASGLLVHEAVVLAGAFVLVVGWGGRTLISWMTKVSSPS